MKNNLSKYLLVAEVILCFALPAYFLFWGILTLPLWLMGASSGAAYALIHALCTIGGCLGLIAIVFVLRYLLLQQPSHMHWFLVLPLTVGGVLSIWTTMTGQFAGFELSWFSVLSTVAPTLCAIHLLWLAARRYRRGSPNNPMHATSEDARA